MNARKEAHLVLKGLQYALDNVHRYSKNDAIGVIVQSISIFQTDFPQHLNALYCKYCDRKEYKFLRKYLRTRIINKFIKAHTEWMQENGYY